MQQSGQTGMIEEKILKAIADDPEISNASNIFVSFRKGGLFRKAELTITGKVNGEHEKKSTDKYQPLALYNRPERKMPTISRRPSNPAMRNPSNPTAGKPNIFGPVFTLMINEDPMVIAAITMLKERRLIDLSISVMKLSSPLCSN